MTLLYSTHPLMSTMLQGPSYRTPKRPATEMERRTSTSTSSDVPRPFRPERGYEVTGIVDSGPSDDDDDKEKSPPRRSNVPYDAERARRDKLRRKAERKAKWEKEEERRSEMKAQARKSTSPARQTSQGDNWKPQEEEKKRSPTRPPRGPNTYKKTYNTGSADRIHRNSKDY